MGSLAVGPPEGGPPGGQPVDARGLNGLLAVAAQQGPQIVRGDEQDIGAVLGRGGRGRGRQQWQGNRQQHEDHPSWENSCLEIHGLSLASVPMPLANRPGTRPAYMCSASFPKGLLSPPTRLRGGVAVSMGLRPRLNADAAFAAYWNPRADARGLSTKGVDSTMRPDWNNPPRPRLARAPLPRAVD